MAALFSLPIFTTSLPPQEPITAPPPPPIVAEEHVKVVDEDKHTLCNCYAYAEKYTGINLPPMAQIAVNTDTPIAGSIAVMFYGRVKHVAVVTAVRDDGVTITEANYNHCEKTTRDIPYSYHNLHGFYTPG